MLGYGSPANSASVLAVDRPTLYVVGALQFLVAARKSGWSSPTVTCAKRVRRLSEQATSRSPDFTSLPNAPESRAPSEIARTTSAVDALGAACTSSETAPETSAAAGEV